MRKTHYIPVTADVPGAASDANCALIRRTIRTALSAEGVTLPYEVDVLLTDDDGIHQINRDMRQVDRPTDVLSFPEFGLVPGQHPRCQLFNGLGLVTGGFIRGYQFKPVLFCHGLTLLSRISSSAPALQ